MGINWNWKIIRAIAIACFVLFVGSFAIGDCLFIYHTDTSGFTLLKIQGVLLGIGTVLALLDAVYGKEDE